MLAGCYENKGGKEIYDWLNVDQCDLHYQQLQEDEIVAVFKPRTVDNSNCNDETHDPAADETTNHPEVNIDVRSAVDLLEASRWY